MFIYQLLTFVMCFVINKKKHLWTTKQCVSTTQTDIRESISLSLNFKYSVYCFYIIQFIFLRPEDIKWQKFWHKKIIPKFLITNTTKMACKCIKTEDRKHVVRLIPVHGELYLTQLYMNKFVSNQQQLVSCQLWFPPWYNWDFVESGIKQDFNHI
jgi:hypothetical protein